MQTEVGAEVPIIRPTWLNITEQPVGKILVSSALNRVVAALSDGNIRIVDLKSGETVSTFRAHNMGVLTAALSEDGKHLATSGEDNKIKIFDLETLTPKFEWKSRAWIDTLLWANQDLFFTTQKKLFVFKYNTQEPQVVDTWEHSLSALTLKNKLELGAAGYSRLSVYDLQTLKEKKRFDWKGQLESLVFSPRERFAVCASNDLSIHIWDLKRDKDLSMRGFPAKIRDLSFRPDGLYMANTSGTEIVVWDYMDPGPANKKPQVLGPFEKTVNFARYQNKGKMLASFGEDGVILFWRPDLFEDHPIAIAGIRDQAITSALWSEDDQSVITGLQTGYLALYPVPEVKDI